MQTTADMAPWNVLGPEIMDTPQYLSSANAPEIEEDVRLCVASGARTMILNCSSMTYMTGAGVRAMLNMARIIGDVGGTLAVKGLSGQPREIFDACGIDSVVRTIDESEMRSLFAVQTI